MSEAAAASDLGVEADVVRIMQMIPHRYPFLMIDRVIQMYADKGAVGIKNVSFGEPYFQGHFPGAPVMPGVMIVEAMAQTAAVLVVHTLGPASEGKLVYFMSIDNCRFSRPVYPGDQLHVLVEKERNRGPVWKVHGTAKVGDKVVAEAVFAAMVRENT
ncbi:MAG TPA: 3-hydroxyacyl-ACP dehydratase FabZ [Dongiaceae bacterium]